MTIFVPSITPWFVEFSLCSLHDKHVSKKEGSAEKLIYSDFPIPAELFEFWTRPCGVGSLNLTNNPYLYHIALFFSSVNIQLLPQTQCFVIPISQFRCCTE